MDSLQDPDQQQVRHHRASPDGDERQRDAGYRRDAIVIHVPRRSGTRVRRRAHLQPRRAYRSPATVMTLSPLQTTRR